MKYLNYVLIFLSGMFWGMGIITTKYTVQKVNRTTELKTSILAIPTPTIVYEGMYKLINDERSKVGLTSLSVDTKLQETSTKRACEIKVWSHEGWLNSIKGINYKTAGENLAKNFKSDESAMTAFMNSKTHKENILDPVYTHVGVGHCGIYIVQHFASY